MFLVTAQLFQFSWFDKRTYRLFCTDTASFIQHSSYNFTLSIIPERGTFLIVISCGNFNIARDRNTLLGSEILSPLNRRLQCERVRMRLIRDKKTIFESKPIFFVYLNSVSWLSFFKEASYINVDLYLHLLLYGVFDAGILKKLKF